MKITSLNVLSGLLYNLETVHGYLTDTSCADLECCTRFCEYEDYEEALENLKKYGVEVSV